MRQLLTWTNFLRLMLAIFLIFSIEKLEDAKTPWETTWGKRMISGKEPSLRENIKAGLWFGEVARTVGIAAVLGLTFLWGNRKRGETNLQVDFQTDKSPSKFTSGVWWGVLGCILIGSLIIRLPRMSHSFWGDEASAMTTYVHGQWRPVEKGDLQGPLKFEPASWQHTFFSARNGANNHVFFSVTSRLCLETWRKINGYTRDQFSEAVARIPSLIGGLLSITGLALLLRQWKVPGIGLLAALFFALHPWHVRYSAEARGYALVLAMMPFFLMALSKALEQNRWKHWLLFGLLEFLMMWSWGGIFYALAAISLTALALLLSSKERWSMLGKFATAHVLAASVFISLYVPHIPQIIKAKERLLWIKGLPMDEIWFHNVLAETFTGIPWHGLRLDNPELQSWERLLLQQPFLAWISLILIAVTLIIGTVSMWKRGKSASLLLLSILIAAVVCTLHFKFVLGDELRTWYLNFTTPSLAIMSAFGIAAILGGCTRLFQENRVIKMISQTAVIAATCAMLLPMWFMDISQMKVPYEDFKNATNVTRFSTESFIPTESSKIYTAWLWRHSPLYDPRGNTYVRSGPSLLEAIKRAKEAGGDLYVVIGFRSLVESGAPDMLAVLNNPLLFEKKENFFTREDLHSLYVYRMK